MLHELAIYMGKTKACERTFKTQKALYNLSIILHKTKESKAHERTLKTKKALCNLSMILHETKVSKEFFKGKSMFSVDLIEKKFSGSFSLCEADLCCVWSTMEGFVPLWCCVPSSQPLSMLLLLIHSLASSLEEKHLFSEISIGRYLRSIL